MNSTNHTDSPDGMRRSDSVSWLSLLLKMGLYTVTFGFVVMIPMSLGRYTSVGFDLERAEDGVVVEDFYRVRWPGDGTFRVGKGSIHYSPDEEDIDPVDLALRILTAPEYGIDLFWWRRFAIERELPEGDKGDLQFSTWLITPSWFPAVVLFALSYVFVRPRGDRGRSATGPSPDET